MKTALLVIDVQNAYTNPESDYYCINAKKTVSNINKLISNLKLNEVIYIRHMHKEDGSDLGRMYDYLEGPTEEFDFIENTNDTDYDLDLIKIKNSKEIKKTRYSAFQGTDLNDYLQGKGIKKIIVTGFMTNFCCESTARDAHDKDYYVDFISDATGSPGPKKYKQEEIRKIVGEFIKEGFARVFTVKTYLNKYKK